MALFLPMLTSCFNDEAIWEKFDEIEGRLDSLENQLNSQVEAMSALLEDGSTVSSCKKNDDGSYTITLSNGTKFTVLPDGTDFSSLVTYTEVGGKKCWATYGPDGALVALKDASGNAIPVSVEASVKVKDGIYYLVLNGKEFATGYDAEEVVQVFSSCTPLEDASGNVYAVTFTFGEGMEITVALDGYAGVLFKISSVNNSVLTDYYIDYGATQTFLMETAGVIDYVMQVPDGWRVIDYVDELTGETYIKVTAPVKETVDLGAAVSEGDLKVVSVVEGGKASVSKMHLSTDPYKTYEVSKMKAVIEPYTGIQKFAYGMMLAEDFDKAELLTKIGEILTTSTDIPKGYYVSEKGIDIMYEDIFGEELSSELEYLFWAVPVLYREEAEGVEAGFYVEEDMLRTLMLAPISAKIEVSDITLFDAKVKVRVGGTLSMYAGAMEKADNFIENIVYQISNEIVEAVDIVQYEGPVSEFPSGETSLYLDEAKSYIVWVVPVDPDKTTYSAADVIYKEFKTPEIKDGGTLAAAIGDFSVTASSISTTISSADAAMIYYAYLSAEDGERYKNAENATKLEKMKDLTISSGFNSVRGFSVEATVKGIRPETTKWLYAVAVGHDGLYGDVICKSAKTSAVSFNDLVVSIGEPEVGSDRVSLSVSVTGGTATDFIYWCGASNEQFWSNANFCGGDADNASQYLAANPDASEVAEVMSANGAIGADGSVKITGLSLSTEHIFVVLAKDADGKYSMAAVKKFTTLAANFGNLVETGTTQWNTQKEWIENNIVWHKEMFGLGGSGQGFSSYGFAVKIPTDHKAYITCFSTVATKTADIILEIEELCSSGRDVSRQPQDENGNEVEVSLPDWTDDNGKLVQGTLFNYFVHYLHGVPSLGYVTYFPSAGHSNCLTWEAGECLRTKAFEERLAELLSLDHWIEYITDFGNYYYNDDPYHEYSRRLEDPERIKEVAQQYLDLYTKYFSDAEPIVFVNNGDALEVQNREAVGLDDKGNVLDKVTIVLVDANGNYYEPMYIDVPNYYK